MVKKFVHSVLALAFVLILIAGAQGTARAQQAGLTGSLPESGIGLAVWSGGAPTRSSTPRLGSGVAWSRCG